MIYQIRIPYNTSHSCVFDVNIKAREISGIHRILIICGNSLLNINKETKWVVYIIEEEHELHHHKEKHF